MRGLLGLALLSAFPSAAGCDDGTDGAGGIDESVLIGTWRLREAGGCFLYDRLDVRQLRIEADMTGEIRAQLWCEYDVEYYYFDDVVAAQKGVSNAFELDVDQNVLDCTYDEGADELLCTDERNEIGSWEWERVN